MNCSGVNKDIEELPTIASTRIYDKKLLKIESDFRLVTSIYDDMSEIQHRQSGHLISVNSNLEAAVKRTTEAREEMKQTMSYSQQGSQGLTCKSVVIGLSLLTLLVAIRVLRG